MRTYKDNFRGTSHLLPSESWSSDSSRPSLRCYDYPPCQTGTNMWNPVTENLARPSLPREFSRLGFDSGRDKYIRDEHFSPYSTCTSDWESDGHRLYNKANNGKLSKPFPTRRVQHEAHDRLVQIPIQHYCSLSNSRKKENKTLPNSRIPEYKTLPTTRRRYVKYCDNYVDLSDESDDIYSESLSDDSDCDIAPFVNRNINNSGTDVKTRRGRSTSNPRTQPYSINTRNKSPNVETDCRLDSPPNTHPSRIIPASDDIRRYSSRPGQPRSSHPGIICLSDDENDRSSKRKDRIMSALPSSSQYENDLSEIYDVDITNQNRNLPSSSKHRSTEKSYIIGDEDFHSGKISGEKNAGLSERAIYIDDKKQSSLRSNTDSDGKIMATPSYPAYNMIRDVIEPEQRQVDYIRGDGNCFFRALSKVIYNTETCHEELRQTVVDLMEKYPKDFEQFIDGKSIHSHIISMRRDGTWATQAEIYGAATLLQRDVYMLSPDHSGKFYRWLLFSPRFKQSDVDCFDQCYITLCHTNGNHYDRIAPLVGKCNCALMPPQLSGAKGHVDLTTESEEDLLIV
ncbi:uncharacterized protein LOC143080682 [Mytilus galloprovincialis]|uniref:uncharacterized protein LOC143080682 n=1 Tax=Mytilus galloprovincialis TaxID=29158 RepID=UPI003F7C2F18